MSRRIIARNAAALMLSDVIVRVLPAIAVVLVARSLGPRAYGILTVALAFSGIVGYLSDLGLTHLTVQHITRPNADVGRILATVFKVRLFLVLAVLLASLAGIWVLYPKPEQRTVMLAVVLPSICGIAMQGFAASYFWATQQLHVTAGLKTANQVFSAIALALAFLFRWPVQGVAAIYGLASLLAGFVCLWLVWQRAPKMSGWDMGILKGLTSFTVGGITSIALPQLGPLIMERVTAPVEVGYFGAASRIPGLLYTIPGSLGMAWYPQLFRAGSRDAAQHFALSVEQLKLNAILGFGLALPTALYSKPLLHTVLGPSWEGPTAPILSLLCWMVVLNSLSTPLADALTTKGMQTRRAIVYVAALAIGSILFAALASTGGARGAATAAILTQILLGVGLVVVNPSGHMLLSAASRRFLRPVCLASASVFIVHKALPDSLVSAGLSLGTFFLVAVASDLELRTLTRTGAAMIYARLKGRRVHLPSFAVSR
jgi:O-antigen/teichoic acid export membrane protein